MVTALKEVFGVADTLDSSQDGNIIANPPEKLKQLHSPEQLRKRILIKGSVGEKKIDPDLDKMTYLRGKKYKPGTDFDQSAYSPNQMSSFNEETLPKMDDRFVAYTSSQIARIYPKGTRTDSSNYDPIPFWRKGAQLVALNYQTRRTHPMLVEFAKFSENNHRGYNLRPLQPIPKANGVVIRLHGVRGLPQVGKSASKDRKFYIEVAVYDGGESPSKFQTETKSHSSVHHIDYEQEFELPITQGATNAQDSYLVLKVKYVGKKKPKTVGVFVAPITVLREGLRSLELRNRDFESMPAHVLASIRFASPEQPAGKKSKEGKKKKDDTGDGSSKEKKRRHTV